MTMLGMKQDCNLLETQSSFNVFDLESSLDRTDHTFSRQRNRSSSSSLNTLKSTFGQIYDRFFGSKPSNLSDRSPLSEASVSDSAAPDIRHLATASSSVTTFSVNTHRLVGTFGADIFTVSPFASRTVISGNGNIDFGKGYHDLLDLSSVFSHTITFTQASPSSGVVYNPGNGSRVFDAINFQDGRQILFEGIDSIRFADGILPFSISPNDPLFSEQWNLHMIGVQGAWRFTTGATNVLIGVQDTGLTVDRNNNIHPELGGRTIWLTNNQGIDEHTDFQRNHGTQVQGIIAANTNNGIGMSGINWNSSVFNIDVLGEHSSDLETAEATQIMINQARQNGQRLVINLSFGTNSFGRNNHQALEQVVQNNPDVLFVISAGNSGHIGQWGIASPAILARSYANVIAAGAVWGTEDQYGRPTRPGDRIQYNDGLLSDWGSQYGEGLTLTAPSQVFAPTTITQNGTEQFAYEPKFGGTSAAAPNITGVASLVLSVNPTLSAAQVRQILAETAIDLNTLGYDYYTGSGVVNADAAVRRAVALSYGYA